MRYVGNLSESAAESYKDRRYTHSTTHKGQEVRWYDCWEHSDELGPAFGEDLNKSRVSAFDQVFNKDKNRWQ